MTEPTRHVTLCVTHPGGHDHRTLDHHIPAQAAAELEAHVGALLDISGGGRHVTLHTSGPGGVVVFPALEVDDATADATIAAMLPYMPESVRGES
jgi:hypothetical protein